MHACVLVCCMYFVCTPIAIIPIRFRFFLSGPGWRKKNCKVNEALVTWLVLSFDTELSAYNTRTRKAFWTPNGPGPPHSTWPQLFSYQVWLPISVHVWPRWHGCAHTAKKQTLSRAWAERQLHVNTTYFHKPHYQHDQNDVSQTIYWYLCLYCRFPGNTVSLSNCAKFGRFPGRS